MSLVQAIHDVAGQPASIQHRAALALTLAQMGVPETSQVWWATVQAAAARGQFFSALTLARNYLDTPTQVKFFHELGAKFGKQRSRTGSIMPPPIPAPYVIPEMPAQMAGQVSLAIQVGTRLDGVALPAGALMPEIPIFGELPGVEFAAFARSLEEVRFQKGERLLCQGESEQSLFLLTHGLVGVTQQKADGEIVVLAQTKAPAVMGEMSLLTAVPRRASVIALSGGIAWKIDAELLSFFSREHPSLIEQLLTLVKARLLNNIIRSSRLFADDGERDLLLSQFDVVTYPPGHEVFGKGVPAPGLFVLLHGEAEVWTSESDGARTRVATLTEGDAFGEFSLLTDQPTNAEVWMPDGGVCLHLPAAQYRRIRTEVPALDEELHALMDIRRGELGALVSPFADGFEGLDEDWLIEPMDSAVSS